MTNLKTNERATIFSGGHDGLWKVKSVKSYRGPNLPAIARLNVHGDQIRPLNSVWSLCGVASNDRYVERKEKTELQNIQAPLGRTEATCAALIPIQKSEIWWTLTQDERREIFEVKSHHIAMTMKHLPAIARKLYHCRDLGEPFDFVTWFEFEAKHEAEFDELLIQLRASVEWTYVTREVDIRLARE